MAKNDLGSNYKCACAYNVESTVVPLIKVFKSSNSFFSNLIHTHLSMQHRFQDIKYANKSKHLITLAIKDEISILSVWAIKKQSLIFHTKIQESTLNIITMQDQIVFEILISINLWCNHKIVYF